MANGHNLSLQPAGLLLLTLISYTSTTLGSSSTDAKAILEAAMTSLESRKDAGAICSSLESLRYVNFRQTETIHLEEVVKLFVDVFQRIPFDSAVIKRDDVYLECMSMGMRIADEMTRAFPTGTTLRMLQSDRDVTMGNQKKSTNGDLGLFEIDGLFDSTRKRPINPPCVIIDSRLLVQGFLGYSAEIETSFGTKHDRDDMMFFNTTSSFHASSQTGEVILQYTVPVNIPRSNSTINLLRREEAIVLMRDASVLASVSSRTVCTISAESDRRTIFHNDCKVVDRGGIKTEMSCNCRHEDNVTFFIKVYFSLSETLRWIYTISCVASFLCTASALIRLACARCLWKSDASFIRVNFLVAMATTSINLMFSLQAIDNQLFCKSNVILMHLAYIAAPAWIVCHTIETFIQSRKPLQNFVKSLPKRRIYTLIGWGIPIITVALTVGTDMSLYRSKLGCLADFNSTLMWLFMVPVIAATMVISCLLILSTKSLVTDQKGLNLQNEKQEMRKSACSAVLTTVVLFLMPLSLRSPPSEILTATQWLFIIVNALMGMATLLFSYQDTKDLRTVSTRVSSFNEEETDERLGEQSKDEFTKTKGQDRGASYIEVDFTPIIPTSISVHSDLHEDDFTLVDGAEHEEFPEVALRPISCTPRSDSEIYSGLMSIPGSVSDESNYVEQVKVTHRILEKGNWHVVEEEKVVRKVYRRPQTKRETTAV